MVDVQGEGFLAFIPLAYHAHQRLWEASVTATSKPEDTHTESTIGKILAYTPDAPFTANPFAPGNRFVVDNVAGVDGTGEADGQAYTVVGVGVGDVVVAVEHISTAAAVATIVDLDVADFEVSAVNTILDHSGAADAGGNYASDQLRFTVAS